MPANLSRTALTAIAGTGLVLGLAGCNNAGEGAFAGAALGALSGLAIGPLSGNAGDGAAMASRMKRRRSGDVGRDD